MGPQGCDNYKIQWPGFVAQKESVSGTGSTHHCLYKL